MNLCLNLCVKLCVLSDFAIKKTLSRFKKTNFRKFALSIYGKFRKSTTFQKTK